MPRVLPLDLERTTYSYVERPNATLVDLLSRHVLSQKPDASVLDIGCGAGANARSVMLAHPEVRFVGIEPNRRAAELANEAIGDVFHGALEDWLATAPPDSFDAVVLADVLEHVLDPVKFLRTLVAFEGAARATWIISIPNYGVWYNRALTLAGRFRYGWSGLYDRTHLRFFTRSSLHELLRYVGLRVVADCCTPSLVQSMAPVLRSFFAHDVAEGNHLSLPTSSAYQAYQRFVEPFERRVCRIWPELLGFQIVTVARRSADPTAPGS